MDKQTITCPLSSGSGSSHFVFQAVKVESGGPGGTGESLMVSQIAELHFLRSRVHELEREKAALTNENQRLKNMLVSGESRCAFRSC